MHPTLEGAFRRKMDFLLFLATTWPILLIDCPPSSVVQLSVALFPRTRKKPGLDAAALILTQPPCPPGGGDSPSLHLPFPKMEHSRSPVSLAWACPGPARSWSLFSFPTGNNFPGHGSPGCQSLAFTKAHACVTVALLLVVLEFPLRILCLSAAGIFLKGIIPTVRHKKGLLWKKERIFFVIGGNWERG